MFARFILVLILAVLSFSRAFANVGEGPRVGRLQSFKRVCKTMLDPGFTMKIVTPPAQAFARRLPRQIAFDSAGESFLMVHEGARHELQATAFDLASGEIIRAIVGPSAPRAYDIVNATSIDDRILIQIRDEQNDGFTIFDGADSPLVRRAPETPSRWLQPASIDQKARTLASPINVRHHFFVTDHVRPRRFGAPRALVRVADWLAGEIVPLADADPRYLEMFKDPISAEAQRLALVEDGGRSIRLISMDAFLPYLRKVGRDWSKLGDLPHFEHSPVIRLDAPLRQAFWLDGDTRLITVTETGMEVWDGTRGRRLDHVVGDFETVTAVSGTPLLRLERDATTSFYAVDLEQVVRTFAETGIRVFDREPGRIYILGQAGLVREIRRQENDYLIKETGVKVDLENARVGGIDFEDETYVIVAGVQPDVERNFVIKAYRLGPGASPELVMTRAFSTRANAPFDLAPGGRHLVFAIDEVRTAIVDLERLLSETVK